MAQPRTIEQAVGAVARHSVATRTKLNQQIKQRRNSVYDVYGLERNAIGSADRRAVFFVPITPDVDKIIRWEFKLMMDSFVIPIAENGIAIMPTTLDIDPIKLNVSSTHIEKVPNDHSHTITPNPIQPKINPRTHGHNVQVVAGIQLVQPTFNTVRIYVDGIDMTDMLKKQFPLPDGAGIFPDDTLSNRYDIVEACELLTEEQRNKILQAGFHRVEIEADGVYSARMIEFMKYSSINRHGNTTSDEEGGNTDIYPDAPPPDPNPPVNPAESNWKQVVVPNVNIGAISGMCLAYVDDGVGAPARQPTAQASWNVAVASGWAHGENPPVGVWVPIYFTINNGNWAGMGHVAWYYSDGTNTQIHDANVHAGLRGAYSSIQELMSWMGWSMNYLGWSEVLDGVRMVTPASRKVVNRLDRPRKVNMSVANIQPEFGVDVSSKYDLVIEKKELEDELENLTGTKAHVFTETARIRTALTQINSTLEKIRAIEELKGEPYEL